MKYGLHVGANVHDKQKATKFRIRSDPCRTTRAETMTAKLVPPGPVNTVRTLSDPMNHTTKPPLRNEHLEMPKNTDVWTFSQHVKYHPYPSFAKGGRVKLSSFIKLSPSTEKKPQQNGKHNKKHQVWSAMFARREKKTRTSTPQTHHVSHVQHLFQKRP